MNRVKELRTVAGKTQYELATELGITQGAVAHYEMSRRKPGLDMCRRIVSAINEWGVKCSINDVFPPERA
ncbi:MAG: helix-turn-helix transcriptional regulator [Aeromonas sp.]